jgi:ABC-2 type transport system ATP-binding protein
MIRVQNLMKRYGATVAVNDVSFEVQRGEIVGFLGPNGAGKSTTIKIVTCYIAADSGVVVVDGLDALEQSLEVRQRIGYLPESTPLYPEMQVGDYLRFIARIRKLSPAHTRDAMERVVGLVGIERMMKKNIAHLSKGYRQRVGIAQALLHDPPILIMDEPTSGLDPHQIIEIRELIRVLGQEKVIVLSSHILQEISAVCTRILIIKDGRIVANGSREDLEASVRDREVIRAMIRGDREAVMSGIRALSGVEKVELLHGPSQQGAEGPSQQGAPGPAARGDGYREYLVHASKDAAIGEAIFKLAVDRGWTLSALAPKDASLEAVYLRLTASPGAAAARRLAS